MKKTIVALLALLFCNSAAASGCAVEIPAMTFIGLSEINYAHPDGDYVEFFVNKPENVDSNQLEILIDGKNVYGGEELERFNVIKHDLVSTTEQVLVSYGGNVIDGFCWTADKVSQNEVDDLVEYESFDLEDCWNTEEIDKSLHFARSSFTFGGYESEWELVSEDTIGEPNIFEVKPPLASIDVQSGDLIGFGSVDINLDGSASFDPGNLELAYYWNFDNGVTSNKENPPKVSFDEVGNYVVELLVENTMGGVDSDYIYVSVLPEITQHEEHDGEVELEDSETENDESENLEDAANDNDLDNEVELEIFNFMANPEGSDTGNEWVEIKNIGLSGYGQGWSLDDEDGGSSRFALDEVYFEADSVIRFSNGESRVNLNNSDEKVRLFKNELIVDEIYYDKATSGVSYLDSLNTSEETKNENQAEDPVVDYREIRINEFLPNPEGADTGNEWVELLNYGNQEVDLEKWWLQINKKKVALSGFSIDSQAVISIDVSGISNSGGYVALYNEAEYEVDLVEYSEVEEGKSYALVSGTWMWVDNMSKNDLNPEIRTLEGVILGHNLEEQSLTIEDLELIYEDLETLVSEGDLVRVSYIDDVIISIEKIVNDNVNVAGYMKNGFDEIDSASRRFDYKLWVYLGVYGLTAIIAFAFRKPLFQFMKTKLQEI